MSSPRGAQTYDTPLLAYFLLVVALSVPFYVAGVLLRLQLLPGLPVSALVAVCPAVAASILVYRRHGKPGVVGLLRRSFDFGRITRPIWYVPIVLLMPAVMVLSYGVMVVVGTPVPEPQLDLIAIAPMLVVFFIMALGEELGWSGYAFDPMQQRRGTLRAALALGVVWAAWHVVPLFQAGRTLSWIAWWVLGTIALRVLHAWIFVHTGRSVFGQAVFHAMSNLAWQLFPNRGSHYDPAVTAPIVATIAVFVTVVGGLSPRRARDASPAR